VQRLPLPDRNGMIGLPGRIHPWIDLVLDAVKIRRTHQDVGLRSHLLFNCSTALALYFCDFLYQSPQKRLDVGHQADRLEAAAITELDHGGRIDIDANDLHPGGQQIADGDRMQHCGDHQAVFDVADAGPHLPLGF
jgi:hypothetical protein